MTLLSLISLAIVFVLLFLVIRKKLDIFGVVLFLTPYQLISIELGLTLYGYQIALLILIMISMIRRVYNSKINLFEPYNGYLKLYILYAIIVTMLVPIFNETYISVGGFFRNEGRFISQIVVLLLSFMIIPLAINYVKTVNDLYKYFKVFLYSLIVLCLLGWLQWLVYNFLGFDIFPLRYAAGGHAISGLYSLHGNVLFRMSSLGGEPKTLSVSLIIGFFVIHVFNRYNVKFFKYDTFIKYAFLFTSFSTLSTSGIVMFIILFVVYFLINMSTNKKYFRVMKKKNILYSIFLLMIFSIFLSSYMETFYELFKLRVLDRNIGSEDFDFVVQSFIMDNPIYLLFGAGLGNIHNLAYPYIPLEYAFYMADTIFVAKSGYLKIISELGVIGFVFFMAFNVHSLKKMKDINKWFTLKNKSIVRSVFMIVILVLTVYMARTSSLPVYLALFSILNAFIHWNTNKKKRLHEN